MTRRHRWLDQIDLSAGDYITPQEAIVAIMATEHCLQAQAVMIFDQFVAANPGRVQMVSIH